MRCRPLAIHPLAIRPLAIRMLLVGIATLLGFPATADMRIAVAVHGDDPAFEWSCPLVARAIQRRLAGFLGELVRLELEVFAEYQASATAFNAGLVQALYLPELQRMFVLNPSVDARVLDAWRTTTASLQSDEVRATVLADLGSIDHQETCRRSRRSLRRAADTRLVPEHSQIMYVSVLPRYDRLAALHREMTVAFLNALPATAAGTASTAERTDGRDEEGGSYACDPTRSAPAP